RPHARCTRARRRSPRGCSGLVSALRASSPTTSPRPRRPQQADFHVRRKGTPSPFQESYEMRSPMRRARRNNEALLAGLADGSLPDAERERAQRLVGASPELTQELEGQRRALTALEPLNA